MKTALVLVDLQNDFCPPTDFGGGRLAVEEGDHAVKIAWRVLSKWFERVLYSQPVAFDALVLTQDWHPKDHMSFASQHPGKSCFATIQLGDVPDQVLWPDHCIQATAGSDFALLQNLQTLVPRNLPSEIMEICQKFANSLGELQRSNPEKACIDFEIGIGAVKIPGCIVRKGTEKRVDSYSAFLDNDRRHQTPLASWLRMREVGRLVVMGLATDYCVKATALDGRNFGFEVQLAWNGCRAVDPSVESHARVRRELKQSGVEILDAESPFY